jgi:hypothetical protein
MEPDTYVIAKYSQGLEAGFELSYAPLFDRFVLRLALLQTFFLKIADIYCSLFYKNCILRRKLILLLAILENSPSFSKYIDHTKHISRIVIFRHAIRTISLFPIILSLAVLLFMPFHIGLSIFNRTSGSFAKLESGQSCQK